MPRTPGFGLGLAPGRRRNFIDALNSGEGGQWLAERPGVGRRVSRLNPEQQGRIYNWAHTGVDPATAPPAGSNPPNPPPDLGAPPSSGPAGGGNDSAWQEMVKKFLGVNVPGGSATIFPTYTPNTNIDYGGYGNPNYNPTYASYTNGSEFFSTGGAKDYTAAAPGEYDVLGNYLSRNLERLGGAGSLGPEYQRQADIASEIAQREIEKNTAGLREAFGSRGGRYSSDLLQGEGDYRREAGQDLALQQAQLLNQLNANRIGELNTTTSGLYNVGQGRAALSDAGMQRGFQAAQQAQQLTATEQAARGRAREAATLQAQQLTANERGARARAIETQTNAERQRMFEAAQQNANRAGTAYLDAVNRAWAEYQAGRLPPALLEAILTYAANQSPPGIAVS